MEKLNVVVEKKQFRNVFATFSKHLKRKLKCSLNVPKVAFETFDILPQERYLKLFQRCPINMPWDSAAASQK